LWGFVVSCGGVSETDVKKYCNTYSDGWSYVGMTHGRPMTGRRQSAVLCRADAEKSALWDKGGIIPNVEKKCGI